jgi:hypothetical protein
MKASWWAGRAQASGELAQSRRLRMEALAASGMSLDGRAGDMVEAAVAGGWRRPRHVMQI